MLLNDPDRIETNALSRVRRPLERENLSFDPHAHQYLWVKQQVLKAVSTSTGTTLPKNVSI